MKTEKVNNEHIKLINELQARKENQELVRKVYGISKELQNYLEYHRKSHIELMGNNEVRAN